MGRPPCCDKVGVKKGPWTPEEDIIKIKILIIQNSNKKSILFCMQIQNPRQKVGLIFFGLTTLTDMSSNRTRTQFGFSSLAEF
uniref:Uncharacterized protein n=1 Tax=Kalanchoe fedtschenkoi TaxID=63787 RepID=A0A7N0TJI3_KALFE